MVLHTCRGIVWIKCRQSGKCPEGGCGKLCKEYSRPPSKFSVFEDSALDCESELLLAGQVLEEITYQFYCRITCIVSQAQSDFDFSKKCYELHPNPSVRESSWATPRNRWLCMLPVIHLSNATHHALLSHTMYDCHAKIMNGCLECHNVCQSM